MEEDINILENGLKATKKNRRGNQEIRFEVNSNYYKALENLIARNKQLEEDKKYISEEKWKSDEAVIFLTERLENALKDRIPKSKVKEKIEELEAMSISKDIYYDDIKRLFQELLED